MTWSLPLYVEVNGVDFAIRNKCDYRVVLDVIEALKDDELTQWAKIYCALFLFYGNDELNTPDKVLEALGDVQAAIDGMLNVISLGEKEDKDQPPKPRLMDWAYDFPLIAPPVSRVLGYSVRDERNFTHWYDFIGAYMEIGNDCTFSNIISIRAKKAKGKQLDSQERAFYMANKKLVDLPVDLSITLTQEEMEWLSSD